MANDRIPVTYVFDQPKGEIRRRKGKGDELLEDKVVAKYDAETGIVTFPSLSFVRTFKTEVITFLAENELPVRSFQRADIKADPPATKAIPPRPKKTKAEGDKTKAVVDWYFKFKPNEFATRYGVLGRYTGKVSYLTPVWQPRPVDALPEYQGEQRVERDVVDVLVATRKTHLTYLPEECVDFDEEDPEPGEERGVETMAAGRETEDET